MKAYARSTAIFAIITMASAADAQTDPLGQLFRKLARPAPTTAPASPRSAPAAMVAPTLAQTETIRGRLASALTAPAIRLDLTDAAAIIESTIAAVACATDATALRSLNGRRLQPRNYGTPDDTLEATAMGGMRYHDRATCVDLNRVASVTKPALNELVLKLNYVSASSGEAKVQTVSFRKVGGQWVIDRLTDFEL